MIPRKRAVDVSRQQICAEHDPGMLDRPVLIQQPRADDGCLLVGVGIGDQRVEPTVLAGRVVVQEDDVLARPGAGSVVARRGKACAFGMSDDPYVRWLEELGLSRRSIRRRRRSARRPSRPP